MTGKKRPRIIVWICKFTLKFILAMVIFSLCQVLTFRFLDPPVTVNMIWERISFEIWGTRYVKPVYLWKDLEKISLFLQRAVMASEDQRFLAHNGFDFQEIKIVLREIVETQQVRGASTITMQAARSLFLPATRNPLRKLAEAWYTLLIEQLWNKKRILEIYLNTVDWGTGVVGAQAGAREYFSTEAARLSRDQAALMAAVLPSPHRWSVKNPSPHVRARQQRILKDMGKMRLP